MGKIKFINGRSPNLSEKFVGRLPHRLTWVAVAQPHFFKYKSQYLAKLDFKTTVLTSGCFFV